MSEGKLGAEADLLGVHDGLPVLLARLVGPAEGGVGGAEHPSGTRASVSSG